MNKKFLPDAVLFIIAFVLSNLAFPTHAKARTEHLLRSGAGNNTTTGENDSGFGYYVLTSDDSGEYGQR